MSTPTRPSVIAMPPSDGPKPVVSEMDTHSTESEDEEDKIERDALLFRPVIVKGTWEGENEEHRLSLALLMPSGTCRSSEDHTIAVTGNGRVLEVKIRWPGAMRDILYLHKSWLKDKQKFPPTHPRLYGFRQFPRRFSSSSDDPIWSTCRVKLPLKVKDASSVVHQGGRFPFV